MECELEFYKENGRWYANVPTMPKEENEMVFGADIFLEKISMGHKRVFICFSDIDDENEAIFKFILVEHDEYGGWYQNADNRDEKIWLCNVTHEVCGEHPAELFVTFVFPVYKDEFYEGRECKHISGDNIYTIVSVGKMKFDGEWYNSVIYKGPDKKSNGEMTYFSKLLSEFNKEFYLL